MDKRADQGKALYAKGKTITGNSQTAQIAQTLITAGGTAAYAVLSSQGNQKVAAVSAATLTIGGTAVNAAIAAKNKSEANKLRAYYAHKS